MNKSLTLGIIGYSILAVALITITIIKAVQFNIDCTGYLKRAADANTVNVALNELNTAINFIESENLTSGYTSILYKTPDEDIGFWYKNLKASQTELESVINSPSSLEKSNVLIKLRETLLDSGDKGYSITAPDGISRYPNNMAYGIAWLIILLIPCIVVVLGFVYEEF